MILFLSLFSQILIDKGPNNSYRLIESCYHTIIPNKCLFKC